MIVIFLVAWFFARDLAEPTLLSSSFSLMVKSLSSTYLRKKVLRGGLQPKQKSVDDELCSLEVM